MANDKMTWVELRKAVAQAANTTEQEADTFLTALLAEITNGLRTDKQVKVKGIGTFSLKWVAPRKSVNIATGEAFVIDGYSKLTFNAESTLKESVEKRIERPKTEDIMADLGQDPMRKLEEQADEIVDILADLGQSPKTKKTEQPQEPTPQEDIQQEDPIDTSTQEEDIAPIAKAPQEVKEENGEEEQSEEQPTTIVETTDSEPVNEEKGENILPPIAEIHAPAQHKHSRAWIGWAVAGVLLLILVGTGFYFRNTIQMWWQCMRDCQPVEVAEAVPVAEPVEIDETNTPAVVPLAEQPREYTRFIGTERVGIGSRLAWISYKYYGVKDLWVFIYEANKDKIRHPNHLEYGKTIRVPLLSEKLMNLSDPETRQLIDNLQQEYLNQ